MPAAPVLSSIFDQVAVVGSLARYWLVIRPLARREVRRWERRAEVIPSRALREHALTNLRDEALNPEAVAVLATLAPYRRTAQVARLLARLQVILDYVDSVGEQPVDDPLRNGLELHRALASPFQPRAPRVDYYHFNPERDDDGYLDALVAACRRDVEALPSIAAVRPVALRAAVRCGEAQAHTHASIKVGADGLAAWSRRLAGDDGYRWWELAAAGISSLALYALVVEAAHPRVSAAAAARIDVAYFPAPCALSVLLDSLVDVEADAEAASYSSIGHYATNAEAAQRLAVIAGEADTAVRALRGGRKHAAIVSGIAALYLSSPRADTPFARPVKTAILTQLGPSVAPIMATMRLRRRFGR